MAPIPFTTEGRTEAAGPSSSVEPVSPHGHDRDEQPHPDHGKRNALDTLETAAGPETEQPDEQGRDEDDVPRGHGLTGLRTEPTAGDISKLLMFPSFRSWQRGGTRGPRRRPPGRKGRWL